jgi:hypothetical protein
MLKAAEEMRNEKMRRLEENVAKIAIGLLTQKPAASCGEEEKPGWLWQRMKKALTLTAPVAIGNVGRKKTS